MTPQEAIDYLLDPIGKREQHDEAVRMAVEALEKQIPKETVKPDSPYFRYACPSCGYYPLSGHYCNKCGQAILYSKEGEG